MSIGLARRACFSALFALLVCALLLGGCGKAGPKYDEVFSSGRFYVKLRHDADRAGATIPQGLDHPVDLSPDQVARILGLVEYQEYGFFKWRDRGPVFFDEEIEALKVPLSDALSLATPDQLIVFQSSARKRDLLLPTIRITTGMIFQRDGKLNLVIGNLNFEEIDPDAEIYQGDPRDREILSPYRLKATPGIEAPAKDPADPYLKAEHQNWIVIDLDLASAPEEDAVPATQEDLSIEERLRVLQELRDKGLITEEEYEQKRKEILEGL